METNDSSEESIVNKLEEIYDLELEALRRAGVAKEKEKGLKIESTEAIRLFRQAIGYILRLRELREDLQIELRHNEHYNAAHVLGHLDDYNRILKSLRKIPTFESAVSSYEGADYGGNHTEGPQISIEGQEQSIKRTHTERHMTRGISEQSNVPLNGSNVQTFVYPRLIRLPKDIENSLIGRCASGK